MSFLNNLKLAPRMALAFGLQVVITAVLVTIAIASAKNTESEFKKVQDNYLPKVYTLVDWETDLNEIARAARNMLIMDNEAEVAKQRQEIDSSRPTSKSMSRLWKPASSAPKARRPWRTC